MADPSLETARIFGMITPRVKELLVPGEVLKHSAQALLAHNASLEPRHLFLFTSCLLVCRKKSETKYSLKLNIRLSTVRLLSDDYPLSTGKTPKNFKRENVFALQQAKPIRLHVFQFETVAERNTWTQMLRQLNVASSDELPFLRPPLSAPSTPTALTPTGPAPPHSTPAAAALSSSGAMPSPVHGSRPARKTAPPRPETPGAEDAVRTGSAIVGKSSSGSTVVAAASAADDSGSTSTFIVKGGLSSGGGASSESSSTFIVKGGLSSGGSGDDDDEVVESDFSTMRIVNNEEVSQLNMELLQHLKDTGQLTTLDEIPKPELWESNLISLERGEWNEQMSLKRDAFIRYRKKRPALPSLRRFEATEAGASLASQRGIPSLSLHGRLLTQLPSCTPPVKFTSLLSADRGRKIIGGCRDGSLILWNAQSFKLVEIMRSIHLHSVVAMCRCNAMLWTGSEGGLLVFEMTEPGAGSVSAFNLIEEYKGLHVISIASDEQSQRVFVSTADGMIHVYDGVATLPLGTYHPMTGSKIEAAPGEGFFSALLCGPDGTLWGAISRSVVRMKVGENGATISIVGVCERSAHSRRITSLCQSASGVWSAGMDDKIVAWLADGKVQGSVSSAGHGQINAMVATSSHVYTAGHDGVVRRWTHDAAMKPVPMSTSADSHTNPVSALALSQSHLWSGGMDKTVCIWE